MDYLLTPLLALAFVVLAMDTPSLCEACHRPSHTALCLPCYSQAHRLILARCQRHLRQIDAQRLQLQPAREDSTKNYVTRSKFVNEGITMAIEDEDMEHWEILLERRERVKKTWEDEKAALKRLEKELDMAAEKCVEASEKDVRKLRESLNLSDDDE